MYAVISFCWRFFFLLLFSLPVLGQQSRTNEDGTLCTDYLTIDSVNYYQDTLGLGLDAACGLFYGKINFEKAIFDSLANFNLATFYGSANFMEAHFNHPANFHLGQFRQEANFSSAYFGKLADFRACRFDSIADFSSVRFDSAANFYAADFRQSVQFESTGIKAQGNFVAAQFWGSVSFKDLRSFFRTYFISSRFKGAVSFQHADLGSECFFKKAIFYDDVDFSSAQLGHTAKFIGTSFAGKVNFDAAVLPDTLYLIDAKIADTMDLTKARLRGEGHCFIELTGKDVDKVKLNYERFKLIFTDPLYSVEQKESVYLKLLITQEKHGFKKGFEKLDKEFQEFSYLAREKHVINWFQKYWLDYGYNPWLLARNLAVLAVIVLVVVVFFGKRNAVKPSYNNG